LIYKNTFELNSLLEVYIKEYFGPVLVQIQLPFLNKLLIKRVPDMPCRPGVMWMRILVVWMSGLIAEHSIEQSLPQLTDAHVLVGLELLYTEVLVVQIKP